MCTDWTCGGMWWRRILSAGWSFSGTIWIRTGMCREKNCWFQYAFQDGEYLFTHAGVSQLWFDYDFCGDASRSVAEQLNNPAADHVPALLRVGYARGGRRGDTGGIFWADKSELEEPMRGYTQIVGHNRVAEVTEHIGPGGGKVVFCDCLRNGLYLYI